MAGALALLHSQAYATNDVPDVLRYGMAGDGLVKEEIQTANATFVYEPVKFHLDMATMAITALMVILLLSLYLWYRRTMDARVHLVLELGNGSRYVRIRVLTLNGALYAYSFHAQTYIESLALITWPPKLLVSWPSFAVRNILGESVQGFPNQLWIPIWEFWQVSGIVHSKAYYCLLMTKYGRQYRLLEFENQFQGRLETIRNHAIFTKENDDNERHVIHTIRDRIELQPPINVSRLYPSLSDLREEMIDETKM